MRKFCIACDAELPDTALSCISCGAGGTATYVCRSRTEFSLSTKKMT